MYTVEIDKDGYFTGAYTTEQGVISGLEVSELPQDWDDNKLLFNKYTGNPDNPWEFDEEKWRDFQNEITAENIRSQRDNEFVLIDKYQLTLVYQSLTDAQKQELSDYRQAWLDAPESGEIPIRLEWLEAEVDL